MTRALLRSAALGTLRSADLELSPGRYVVVSSEPEPLRDLVALAAGLERPRAGQVLLDDRAPYSSPAARRQIAALFASEALPPALTCRGSLEQALLARGEPASGAERVLAAAGLTQLAELGPGALDAREIRSLALALALSHETAQLLCLHEPLSTSVARALVLDALDRHTARGAIVLCTTTSSADALLLGGTWLGLELGRVRLAADPLPRLGQGPWQQVLVECSDAPALSLLLHDSPLGLAIELGSEPHALKVTGSALDVTVREICSAARRGSVEVSRIAAAVPPVEALMAARAGFARGAYEASRAVALGNAAPAPQATPGGYT